MARHGYLREYDEAPDRSDERDRDWSERDRAFMLDRDRNRGDRDFSARMGESRSSSFRGDDRQRRGSENDQWRSRGGYEPEQGYGGYQSDFGRSEREPGRFPGQGDWERSPRNFSSGQDDHYRSWRDRQMQSLDQDYADYCREREQQFHSDFDNWRRNRKAGSRQDSAIGAEAELELTEERALAGEGNTPSPTSAATLGTNNSENTSRGRR